MAMIVPIARSYVEWKNKAHFPRDASTVHRSCSLSGRATPIVSRCVSKLGKRYVAPDRLAAVRKSTK